MNLENIIDFLQKRIVALERKTKVVREKGGTGLYKALCKDLEDTIQTYEKIERALYLADRLSRDFNYSDVIEVLCTQVKTELPRLSFRLNDKKIKDEVIGIVRRIFIELSINR